MPNFVTFDDGLSYIPITDIEFFAHESEGDFKDGTKIKLRNGHIVRTHWDVSKVAEMLGPTANLHY